MADDITLFFGKMLIGHGRLLLALSWSCFSEYQKSCHVLLLSQVVHFEVDSTGLTGPRQDLSPSEASRLLHELEVHQIELEMQNEELHRAQLELRAAKDRYHDLYEFALVGYCTLNEKGLILNANLTAATMMGVARNTLIMRPFSMFLYGIEDRDIFCLQCERLLDTDEQQKRDIRMLRDDGSVLWVQLCISLAPNSEYRVTFNNISISKQFENKLKHSEIAQSALLSKLEESQVVANIGSWEWNLQTKQAWWSNETYLLFGVTPQNYMPSLAEDGKFIHPDDFEEYSKTFEHSLQTGDPFDFDFRLIAKDGQQKHCNRKGKLIYDHAGRPQRFIGTIMDITKRKQAEAASRLSEQQLSSYLDNAGDTIYISEATDGRILNCNQRACLELGYSKEELLKLSVKDIEVKLPPEKIATLHHDLVPGVSLTTEGQHKRKDGSVFPVEVRMNSLAPHQPDLIISFVRNISDQKQIQKEKEGLQSQLIQAQKMESIGVLAGGIAHDFNNILAIIFGYIDMAREDAIPGSNIAKELDQIFAATHRARDLVKQILLFSRQSDTVRIPMKIQPIIKESLKMLRASIPTTISIKEDIDPQCVTILADPTQIYQVVINLCTNAFHAMEKTGGILTVSVGTKSVDQLTPSAAEPLRPGEYVELTVSDTGSGIDPCIIEKIFDPYYTTKELGTGTGMGLSIVHGIIKSYGGAITAHNNLGQGSTFQIYLPVAGVEDRRTTKAELPIQGGRERILLVDDEVQLVEMTQKYLIKMGYTVSSFSRSIEAFEAFSDHPEDFDLLITDQTMPEMTGIELAQRILQISADLPIILCTGYSNLVDEKTAKHIGIKKFRAKPLGNSQLGQLVREALDESQGGRPCQN